MDIPKLKQSLKGELAGIWERSRFIETQKQARINAVDRLTRAEAIAIAANLHELLGWLPKLKVETVTQTSATAISVIGTVTGDEIVSITGLVAVPGDLLSADYDNMDCADYMLFDDFSGDSRPIDGRESLSLAMFQSFTSAFRERLEFALTDPNLRERVLLKAEHLDPLEEADG